MKNILLIVTFSLFTLQAYSQSGNVGIGTTTPSALLTVGADYPTSQQGSTKFNTSISPIFIGRYNAASPTASLGIMIKDNHIQGLSGPNLADPNDLRLNGLRGGSVLIGEAFAPPTQLNVYGAVNAYNLKLSAGANNGYILKSDANGNATWANPNILSASWATVGSNQYSSVTGNVGIGLNAPQSKLHVNGRTQLDGRLYFNSTGLNELTTNSNLAYGIITSVAESEDSTDLNLVLYSNTGYSPWLNFGKARGTFTAPAIPQNNDDIFQINGFGYVGNDFNSIGTIRLYMDGTPTATSTPTGMDIKTVRNGSLISTKSISIRGTGFVGIGDIEPEQNLSVQKGMNIDQEALNDGTLLHGLRFGSGSREGIASRRTGGDDSNFNGLDFFTNNDSRMTITKNGTVGIGTTNPTQAKLVVNGNINGTIGNFGYFRNNDPQVGTNTSGNLFNYSIYASNRIAATEFNAFSDARIKDIKGLSNNEKDLEILSKIQITDYQFIDKIGKGDRAFKKVIAQQLETVYPQAVSKMTDVVPDIYKIAKIENGKIILENHGLKLGEKVKLIFDNEQVVEEVIEIASSSFSVRNLKSDKQNVFVYGREVTDFRSVDYEALSTLNISATQALLKQINELKAENSQLANTQNELKAAIDLIKNQVNTLKKQL